MRKYIVVLVLALAAVAGAVGAPAAQASQYPDVSKLTPFTPEANYMSLPGYLRWQHYLSQGRWMSREQAVQVVRDAGGIV